LSLHLALPYNMPLQQNHSSANRSLPWRSPNAQRLRRRAGFAHGIEKQVGNGTMTEKQMDCLCIAVGAMRDCTMRNSSSG
jgi:hypothetical protein